VRRKQENGHCSQYPLFGYFALSAPGIDYGLRIASFIDLLAQVF
jgi:hypothetical protein